MKKFEIRYNPYNNQIHFRQAIVKTDSQVPEWREIEKDSVFLRFQNHRCIFENCVEDILDSINQYINTSGELEIDFHGTDEDFGVLRTALLQDKDPKSKGIKCTIGTRYTSSSDALKIIKSSYEQIKTEFEDYINNDSLDEDDERAEIGREILRFQDTVKAEIPVCVIGNYSVGKSALVNALVGMEILPSHANSTTAKNVLIENGEKYSISFKYKDKDYILDLTGSDIHTTCSGDVDDELLSGLKAGTEGLETEEQILHQMIENLNRESNDNVGLAEIQGNVKIIMPFVKSELETDKYSFVFMDTPGSNNGDEAQRIHKENLEKLMDEQTNALPVFVMDRRTIASVDNNDLRTLLEKKEAGFAVQNCIIVISLSDQLVEHQLAEELPDKVKQWLNHPTIIYASPIAAIGEKKSDKSRWIDGAYKQIYEKKIEDLPQNNPPQYNITPCNRKMPTAKMESITPMLYASGLPSLETEINYYANRFADYKKCVNGREYLLKALRLANERLIEARNQLEKDKNIKVHEQKEIRESLKKRINSIPVPDYGKVVRTVYAEFEGKLREYCDGVETLAKQTWQENKTKKDSIGIFEKTMAKDCQEKLYDANIEKIIGRIEEVYKELVRNYIGDVQKIITDEYEKISADAQEELNEYFQKIEKGPVLQEVEVDPFEKLAFIIFAPIPVDFIQDTLVGLYANNFKDKLRGPHNKLGAFGKQCVLKPAKEYSKQIVAWSNEYKEGIDKRIDKENAILSELDDKIEELECRIEDLERRLKNVDSVKVRLETVLPDEEEAYYGEE